MRTPPSEEPAAFTVGCLACGSPESRQLGHWHSMPLSVMGLPRTRDEAVDSPTFELDVRRCVACGHVFHAHFDPEQVRYDETSNMVFNQGAGWREYQDELAARWVREHQLEGRLVVEVGAGDGGFSARLAEAGCEVLCYEPGPDADACAERGLRVERSYFSEEDVSRLVPDAIVCRHVIEHLPDPTAFLRAIRRGAVMSSHAPLFLAEVPRIDKALAQHRINDFLYEHVSHFTDHSFRVLFEEAGWAVIGTRPGYGDEVVTLAARPRLRTRRRGDAQQPPPAVEEPSREFRESVASQALHLRRRLEEWQDTGRTVALWGGTGKGAALINMCGLTEDLAPLVIDSDPRKRGRHVPGTGQLIQGPAACLEHGVDVILICTQWRARDIEHEIRLLGFDAELFVVLRGRIEALTPELEL